MRDVEGRARLSPRLLSRVLARVRGRSPSVIMYKNTGDFVIFLARRRRR